MPHSIGYLFVLKNGSMLYLQTLIKQKLAKTVGACEA
jgi:hypothetical protein